MNPMNKKSDASIPLAPSLAPPLLSIRVVHITALSVLIAAAAGLIAQGLLRLIGLITNISFYGRFNSAFTSPAGNHLGLWVIGVPVIGGLIVGLMARYGSAGIRGHGIPEAMEQILTNESRVSPILTLLKPISAAISIGTGGPFGAEGPIIATGGAVGSLVGQFMRTTADERKTLLAAGAAAGMAATFGSPVSAVLLAIELLLFEYRPRSFLPVALASTTAAGIRMAFAGAAPVFAMPNLAAPGGTALGFYVFLGTLIGLFSVVVTRGVYWIEDLFDHLPIHWMWWPAIGAVAVGVVGYFFPRTFGVGYDNIHDILSGNLAGRAVLLLCVMKFISWAISLGSGTSGGTLAPLFTIGGGLGGVLGILAARWFPSAGIDPRIAALVGTSALFAGASRALLASVVFAFETTLQPLGLLPLLGGCSAAYLISGFFMRNTIMTEKIVRRGIFVPTDYDSDILARTRVRDVYTRNPLTLKAAMTLREARDWMESGGSVRRHQGYPVLDDKSKLVGVLTHRDIMDLTASVEQTLQEVIKRPPIFIFPDSILREAADTMVREEVGRLPVVDRDAPNHVLGILTRSDVLSVHKRRLRETHHAEKTFRVRLPRRKPGDAA
jgi:chloride channel protein, CIC family